MRVREATRVGILCPCDECKDEVWHDVMMTTDEYEESRKDIGCTEVCLDCDTIVCLKQWGDGEINEETGRETDVWEGRVVQEEKREVQPFGCASTTC